MVISGIEEFISSNGSARSGHAGARAVGGVEQTGGLAGAVAGDEGFLLRSADPAGELGSDVALDVEDGILQELVRHLDHGGHLMSADGDLTESIVAVGDGAFLIHPGSGTVRSHNGDLPVAGGGLDHGAQGAENILFFQPLYQGALVLIGHKIAALGIGADLQGVHDGRAGGAVPDHAPESVPVFVGSAALLLGSGGSGTGDQRGGGGLIQFPVDSGLALQALDFLAERDHISLHLFITYEGIEHLAYVLGKYTVIVDGPTVKNISWSHDGEDMSGGLEASAWGKD